MIISWMITPILAVINAIFSALPTADTSFLDSNSLEGFAASLGSANYFLPVPIIADCLQFLLFIFFPAVLVFLLAQWLYRELPEIAGFGP